MIDHTSKHDLHRSVHHYLSEAIRLLDQADNSDRTETAVANLKLAAANCSQARRLITTQRTILLAEQEKARRQPGQFDHNWNG